MTFETGREGGTPQRRTDAKQAKMPVMRQVLEGLATPPTPQGVGIDAWLSFALKPVVAKAIFTLAHDLGHVPSCDELTAAHAQDATKYPPLQTILALFGSLPNAFRAAHVPGRVGATVDVASVSGAGISASAPREDTSDGVVPYQYSADEIARLFSQFRDSILSGISRTGTIKYFDLVNEFIVIYSDAETLLKLLAQYPVKDKKAYVELLVQVGVRNLPQVLESVRRFDGDYDPEIVNELLYRLVVDENSNLDVHNVSLPAPSVSAAQTTLSTAPRRYPSLEAAINDAMPTLEANLKGRVLGQEAPLNALLKHFRRLETGMPTRGPKGGVFLLCGTTGTGKTETAKALGQAVFGTKSWGQGSPLIRIDCSEYALPHEYAKLIGSPPGYIGHEQGGMLTEHGLNNPVGIVLFDEVEKAHPKVHNLVLTLLDEGWVTDSKGNRISFENFIILMTSNLGAEEAANARNQVGFTRTAGEISTGLQGSLYDDAIAKFFRPEFINRLTGKLVFNEMTPELCQQIVRLQLRELREHQRTRQGREISWTPAVVVHLTDLAMGGEGAQFGARRVRRLIETLVEGPISDAIADNQALRSTGWHYRLSIADGAPELLLEILKIRQAGN